MPTRCKRGFYCRSYCLLNMFRASLCPSSGAQEYYTVVAACGISCCGFSSSWSGVELCGLWVMCPVCRILQTGHITIDNISRIYRRLYWIFHFNVCGHIHAMFQEFVLLPFLFIDFSSSWVNL